MFISRSVISSALLALATATLIAQAPALDVKLGLWEQTTAVTIAGMPAGMGAPPTTVKVCLTRELLSSDGFMLAQQNGMKCTRTITTNTKSALAADIACSGALDVKGKLNVTATSSEAMTSTITMATAQAGQSMNMTMTTTGKYIGAACGDVK